MFRLPELPYPYDALAPTLSDRTLHEHHDKHHATYVKTVNAMLAEAPRPAETLEQLVAAARAEGSTKLFNNAAQAWNHGFLWVSMSPQGQTPSGQLAAAIDQAFGSVAEFKTAFVKAGAEQFGSGWVWLVAPPSGDLEIRATHDAEGAAPDDVVPLLVCDVWEHAYYLDHQHDRKGFLEAWFDRLADWSFAESQLAAARGGGAAWRFPA